MHPLVPLHRVRVELDKTLRKRPTIARAVVGRLGDGPLEDLNDQLAALVGSIDNGDHAVAARLAHASRRRRPCTAVRLFHIIVQQPPRELSRATTLDVLLAVAGTSWMREASASHENVRPTSPIALVANEGAASIARLRLALPRETARLEPIYAFAELTRGALLGLASYLDATWPAPVAHASVAHME